MNRYHIVIAFVLALLSQVCHAADPSVVLYQTNVDLTQRLGDDVAPFAKYLKDLAAAAAPLLGQDQPELFDVFVIIKPGDIGPFQRSRVWLVSSLSSPPDRGKLKKALETVPPPKVTDGPVIFAMCYALNGAHPRDIKKDSGKPPLPPEWRQQMPGGVEPASISDTVMKNVWPD